MPTSAPPLKERVCAVASVAVMPHRYLGGEWGPQCALGWLVAPLVASAATFLSGQWAWLVTEDGTSQSTSPLVREVFAAGSVAVVLRTVVGLVISPQCDLGWIGAPLVASAATCSSRQSAWRGTDDMGCRRQRHL